MKPTDYARFFNPDKSPRTQVVWEAYIRRWRWDYIPKHMKRMGRMVWNSTVKGTFIRQKHGELK